MKKSAVIIFLITGLLSSGTLAQSPLDDLRKRAEEALGKKSGPTDDRIAAGLKEALTVSTRRAVASTGRVDGFLKNAAIKILLPEKLRNVGKGMRLLGMGQQVDSLEIGMNRAAEQAAPAARQIFIDAVSKMTIADARQILSGGDTAATDYFKTASTDQLTAAFSPIVHRAMENVGVVKQYNQLMQNPIAARVAENELAQATGLSRTTIWAGRKELRRRAAAPGRLDARARPGPGRRSASRRAGRPDPPRRLARPRRIVHTGRPAIAPVLDLQEHAETGRGTAPTRVMR